METARWKKLEAIYHSALAVEANEREEFLQNICGDDAELRQEIKAMLKGDLPTEEFLKDDNVAIGMQILADSEKMKKKTMTDNDEQNNLIGGRYDLFCVPLDAGGIGEIYLADDTRLNKKVVIKFLQNTTSSWIVEKFKDEAVVQSQVSHPNVAVAFDKGILEQERVNLIEFKDRTERRILAKDTPYLVMEFIDGTNVAEIIKKAQTNNEEIEFELIAKIISQAGNGVEAIHLARLVHRDLKPQNLMLSKDGFLKVIDFGITRDLSKATSLMSAGTPAYMPIEQIERQEVSSATDVFALGVIAYQLVTLRLPFIANDGLSHIRARQEGVKVSPSVLRPDLPKEAEKLILQALKYEAKERPQSAKEFGEKLAEILTRKPEPQSKPHYFKPLTAVAAVLILALAVLAGWLWFGAGTKTVQAEEIVATRPQTTQKPTENAPTTVETKPPTVSTNPTAEKPVYVADKEFPTDIVPSGMILAQIGLNLWRSRPATSQDDRNIVARETNDVKEEIVYESKDEFIKNGERFRLSVEAMTKGLLSEGSGYVYIVNREQYADGTFGRARLIFPKTSNYKGDNLLRAGQPIIMPQATGLLFEATRSSSNHIAETYTIIISPWKFALPEPLSDKPMILPDNLFADWERQYDVKMYRANLKNNGNRLMTIQEQKVMNRETNDVSEFLTQSDTNTYPQIVYRGVVKTGNPAMFTVALKFND